MTTITNNPARVRTAGAAATVGFLGFAAFQAALALGAPFGRAAWGGGSTEPATGLRVASGFAVFLYPLAAAIVFQRSGSGDAHLPAVFVRRGARLLTGFMFVGTVMNWASRSKLERYMWGPITLVMAVLCLAIARSPEPSSPPERG